MQVMLQKIFPFYQKKQKGLFKNSKRPFDNQ